MPSLCTVTIAVVAVTVDDRIVSVPTAKIDGNSTAEDPAEDPMFEASKTLASKLVQGPKVPSVLSPLQKELEWTFYPLSDFDVRWVQSS